MTMLVLSRKLDESIVIDGNIEITVLAVQGRRVKLGIRAPGDVSIRRQEIPVQAHVPHDRAAGLAEDHRLAVVSG
jgi:carbon storage regulator